MNERLGLWKLGTFGLQHVLAMYGGAVVVPLRSEERLVGKECRSPI